MEDNNEWMVSAGGGDFVPVPEGLHESTIKEITPPVLEDDKYNPGKQKRKITFIYEVDKEAPNGEAMTARRKYTFSTNPKSHMRPHIEAIIGRKLTADEESSFDVRKLVGLKAKVLIKHTPREDGGVWANISDVLTSDIDPTQPF